MHNGSFIVCLLSEHSYRLYNLWCSSYFLSFLYDLKENDDDDVDNLDEDKVFVAQSG